jgi:hypothetical protein
MDSQNTMDINIPYPDTSDLYLKIGVGACRLQVAPGEGGAWVTGTYEDPTGLVAARILQEGGTARITQTTNWADLRGWSGGVPTFNLTLGTARPFALTVESGASDNTLELGGLPIRQLVIHYGAGKMEVSFSTPNPQVMEQLTVNSGAGSLVMKGLGNANWRQMNAEGGAAAYVFDFGGALRQSASARISTGLCSVEIRVPTSSAAKITTESVVGNLDIGDGFMKKEGAFWTQAALTGDAPLLSIRASVTLGSLLLRTI